MMRPAVASLHFTMILLATALAPLALFARAEPADSVRMDSHRTSTSTSALADLGDLPLEHITSHLNARDFTRLGAVNNALAAMSARTARHEDIAALKARLHKPSVLASTIIHGSRGAINDALELLAREAERFQVRGYFAHDHLLRELCTTDSNGVTPLIAAILRKDEDLVRDVIAAGAPIYGQSLLVDGQRPLVSAPFEVAEKLGLDGVQRLIIRGAKLFLHALNDNMEGVRVALTAEPWLVLIRDNDGRTPLHYARSYAMVRLLVGEFNAPVNVYDGDDGSPLTMAIIRDDVESVRFLLAHGAQANAHMSSRPPLLLAIETASVRIVEALLDEGHATLDTTAGWKWRSWEMPVAVQTQAVYPLYMSALTVTMGMSPPLHHAIVCRRGDVMRALLLRGASAHTPLGPLLPIHLAAMSGNRFAVDILLAAGADPLAPAYLWTLPLHFAAMSGNLATIRTLFAAHGIGHINDQDDLGATPLFHASMRGLRSMVRMLLSHGADPSIQTKAGQTPLLAAATGMEELSEMFIMDFGETTRLAIVRMLTSKWRGKRLDAESAEVITGAEALGRDAIAAYILRAASR